MRSGADQGWPTVGVHGGPAVIIIRVGRFKIA